MNEHEILRDKALLSAAAYTDFFDKNGQKIDFDNTDLHGALGKYSTFTLDDIKYFTTNFEVLHQQLETSSGFSAVLIKDKRTGQVTFAIRGTQEIQDYYQDANLALQGIALHQIVDATNYLLKLMTPIGQKYHHLQIDPKAIISYQGLGLSITDHLRSQWINIEKEGDGLGLISGNIDLTGHSLAHSIAISLSTIFKNISTVSGFNGAGAGLSENSETLKRMALLSGQHKTDAIFHENLPFLPRFGLRFFLDKQKTSFTYLGYGEGESYIDKHHATQFGVYSTTAEKNHVNYLKPQENGSHYGCFYIKNELIQVESEQPFSFNLSPYTQEELTQKKHSYELVPSGYNILCIDYKMSGIGSNSCGPNLKPQYRLIENNINFNISIQL